MQTGVILLAAGRSRRMQRPKLLLPWADTSIIGHQIWTWTALGARQVAVVCADGDDVMRAELDRLKFSATDRIVNNKPDLGMFSSICCAARWAGWELGLTHWVVTLGDQPHIHAETLRRLLHLAGENADKICQPRAHGHLRHPVIFPAKIFFELQTTRAATLRDFLKSRAADVVGCDVDDPGLDSDIDTPADYERITSSSRPAPSASSAAGCSPR